MTGKWMTRTWPQELLGRKIDGKNMKPNNPTFFSHFSGLRCVTLTLPLASQEQPTQPMTDTRGWPIQQKINDRKMDDKNMASRTCRQEN
jgi:hypothetical protein